MTNDKHTEIILSLMRVKQFTLIDNIDIKKASFINNTLLSLGATSGIYNTDDENIEIPHIEKTGVPKCPTCGSEQIINLTVIDRMISTALVGIASGKLGKQFECKKCGYRW